MCVIPVDKPKVGDLVELLNPWGRSTGVRRIVINVADHIGPCGQVYRFLGLNDDTVSWPASYVKVISVAPSAPAISKK